MTNQAERTGAALRSHFRFLVFASVLLFSLTIMAVQQAQAQTFSVLHTFTEGETGEAILQPG